MIRIFLAFTLVAAALFTPAACLAAGDQELNTAQGTVSETDWVGGYLAVGGARFSVPETAQIIKGVDEIGLFDINVGDRVIIRYYQSSSGEAEAVHITVDNT